MDKKKINTVIIKRRVSYRILCNKLDKDICEIIVNNII